MLLVVFLVERVTLQCKKELMIHLLSFVLCKRLAPGSAPSNAVFQLKNLCLPGLLLHDLHTVLTDLLTADDDSMVDYSAQLVVCSPVAVVLLGSMMCWCCIC